MIEYLGKKYNSEIRKPLTDEEYLDVVRHYYEKPEFSEVRKQLLAVSRGGSMTDKIVQYYFKDLMAKVKIYYNNWTIEEALKSKEIIEFFAGKSDVNKKVFPDSQPLWKKVEACFRICGFRVASKPSNFPIKAVDEILKEYNVNNVYYDFSCGWGMRLLGAMRNHVEYLGTDVNPVLVERLKSMAETYCDESCGIFDREKYDIRCIGSEIFQPEWENRVGLAFSSPPYFNLEDYRLGNQSYHEGMEYSEWLDGYMKSTVGNIFLYLVDGGYFIINVKNFNGLTMLEDVKEIACRAGFSFTGVHSLKNIHRCHGHREWKDRNEDEQCGMYDSDEKMLVFQKK